MRRAAVHESTDRFQKKREHTHRELLAAACRVLAEKGYHRARVADIATAAGVSVGTFYLYYPTKEALLRELAEEVVRALKAEVDAVTQSVRDPVEKARARNRTFFRFAQKHRELFRIVFGHGAEFHDVLRNAQEFFIADLAANFREGIASGAFRPFDPHLLAHAFVGMAQQVLRWWIENGAMSADEVAQAVLDFALHGIERPRPPGP
jgi:AcrR family transcriptional regulator